MPEQDLVLVAIDGGIARITLNRPDRLNALDHDLAVALATTLGMASNAIPRCAR